MPRELTTIEKKVTGPLDAGLMVAVFAYGAAYYGLKALHERLMRNLLVAETEWALRLATVNDVWDEDDGEVAF